MMLKWDAETNCVISNWACLPPAVVVTLGGSRLLCQPLIGAGHEAYCRISAVVREVRGSAIGEALFRCS